MPGNGMDPMPATVNLDVSTNPVNSPNQEGVKIFVLLQGHAVKLYFKHSGLYPWCSQSVSENETLFLKQVVVNADTHYCLKYSSK